MRDEWPRLGDALVVLAALDLIFPIADRITSCYDLSGELQELRRRLRDEISEQYTYATPPEVATTWGRVAEGDQVPGRGGAWHLVVRVAEQPGLVLTKITVEVDGKPVSLPKERALAVAVRRGPTGRAIDLFTAGGLDVSVLGSA